MPLGSDELFATLGTCLAVVVLVGVVPSRQQCSMSPQA